MLSGSMDLRLPFSKALLWQAAVGILLALICVAPWGRYAGVSALVGAGIGLVANYYMTRKALVAEQTASAALRRLIVGQAVKVAVTIGLFMAASRLPHIVWPALLGTYLVTLTVFWLRPAIVRSTER
ncbi:MAG: ATP synthase subunit I [Steroidobacteraceae bacterium]